MNSTNQPTLFETLQGHAQLEPLAPETQESLRQVESLNVSAFSEVDVRAKVMEPIVRALGYSEESDFSEDRGHEIKFLEEKEKKKKHKSKPAEHSPKFWKENFWLMEAKRPHLGEEVFHYEALKPALEYACHPKLNAALVVLCDGVKIEVFDRETSVTEPVLRIACKRLLSEFDKLRALLSPCQMRFFQKRRVLRVLDKVFNHEFRAEEFRLLLENVKKQPSSDSQTEVQLWAASTEALVEIHMFQQHNTRSTHALLAALADKNPSALLPHMLPDKARVVSELYMGHALACLMELSRRGVESLECVPSWLAQDAQAPVDLKAVIRKLFCLCLSCFEGDEPRRLSLLAAAACRRLAKVQFVLSETPWAVSKVLHFMHRLEAPKQSFSQTADALQTDALSMLHAFAMMEMHRFMEGAQTHDGAFDLEAAKLQLQKMWSMEKQLLAHVHDYPKRSAERSVGEIQPAESCCVSFDFLGHMTLCLLQLFPEWQDEVLQNHLPEISDLAKLGSWAAKKQLGMNVGDFVEPPEDLFLADRFFLGDVETLRFLRAKYGGQH